MRVRFYGVRESTPTSGRSTVRYGGHTSCVEVRLVDNTVIVFDCGTGCGTWQGPDARAASRPYHFMLSHVHWDHVIGIPFFGPLWSKETQISLYPLVNETQGGTRRTLFDGVHFPVRVQDIPAHHRDRQPSDVSGAVTIGSARVRRVQLNHPGGAQGLPHR